MPVDLTEFGKKLNRCRTQLQLSLAEVAESTGLTADRIQAYDGYLTV